MLRAKILKISKSRWLIFLLFLLLSLASYVLLFPKPKPIVPQDNIRPKPMSILEELACLDTLSKDALENGKKEMARHKLVVCGITRDNAKELPTVIQYIEHTGNFFQDYRVIVFENDSVDGTKDLLRDWQSKSNKVKILTKDYSNNKRPNIAFLAEARNFYLKELSLDPEYQDFDMVMMVDLDMSHGWDMRGLFHSFSRIYDWEAVCSNGVFTASGRMWDIFAFRNAEYSENLKHPDYWSNIAPKGQKIYAIDSDLIPVRSCFGGLAFYKRPFIAGCEYNSVEGDCEHVLFHECLIKNKGRIFMNPAQVLRYSHYQ